MAATFTTEQTLPFGFQVVDGRGRVVAIDGEPTCTVSDETVCTVSIADNGDNTWSGELSSVAEGAARLTIQADADLGAGIQEVLATLDVTVTLDPRTSERMASVTAGTPADKPVS